MAGAIGRSPLQVLTNAMRGSGLAGIAWGASASPFYKHAPEPPVAFPYIVFDLPDSTVQHTGQSSGEGGAYLETITPKFEVYGETANIEMVAYPAVSGSLFWWLDGFADEPNRLDGDGFFCVQFLRKNYRIDIEEFREPDAFSRVWVARAEYDMILETPYPRRVTA